MNKKPTITLNYSEQYGKYIRKILTDDPEEKLSLLWFYLDSCVRYNPENLQTIKRLIDKGLVGCNDTVANMIHDKWVFQHHLWEDMEGPSLSTKELLHIIETWYDLVSKRVDKIVLTYDDGKVAISAG